VIVTDVRNGSCCRFPGVWGEFDQNRRFYIRLMLIENLLSDALEKLPPLDQTLIRRVYLEGDSEWTVSREYGLKRKVVQAEIETGLQELRRILRCWGLNRLADVL
jgi:DNA-directed RNA polymerase specialized sigma24 family protein